MSTTLTQHEYDTLRALYKSNPVGFCRDIMDITLTEQQKGLIESAIGSEAKVAVKSATGTGKTCALAIIILHQLLVENDIKIIATSPSAGQLKRGLRAEVAKLLGRMKHPDFRNTYELMSEEVHIVGARDTRFCSFVTASAENKESLAGVHADKVIILVDEASAVSQEIYDTLIGNLTTTGSSIIQTTNPVRPSGPFYNLFNDDGAGKMWDLRTFVAFDSPHVSDSWIEGIRTEYGEDSDFYRMRVLGEFPRQAATTFIGTDVIEAAVEESLPPRDYSGYPVLVGADIARFGDDRTVFTARQGPKLLDITCFEKLDTMRVADELIAYSQRMRAETTFIDGIGIGAGVVDRCKQLGLTVVDVNFSNKPSDPRTYANLRSEAWGEMRDWLRNGGDIPNDKDLKKQLGTMEYMYNNKMQIQLMSKKDIKRKGDESPDIPDSLSLTMVGHIFQRGKGVNVKARKVIKRNIVWA